MRTQDILDHLEKFMALKAVAKGGSIRKASSLLNISQPSLSVKLKNLEEVLGFRLMERTRDGIFLTQAGRAALEFANTVSEQAEGLRLLLEEEQNELKGHVRIGLYDSIARYLWPSFYKSFCAKYPKITISVSTGRSRVIADAVNDREMDLGIIVGKPLSPGVNAFSLYEDSFSLFSCPELAYSLKTVTRRKGKKDEIYVKAEDGDEIPLILFSEALSPKIADFAFLSEPEKLLAYNVHRVENFEIARAFCMESIGLAVLPNHVVEKEFNSGQLIKLGFPQKKSLDFGHHSIDLIIKATVLKQPVMRVLIEEIQSFVKSSKRAPEAKAIR